MRFNLSRLFLIAAPLFAASTLHAQNILENGSFNSPGDPLKGWVTDYAFAGNSNYMGNKTHVSVVTEGGKPAVKFDYTGVGAGTGVKMESHPFPFEPGFKYLCDIHIKGGEYRVQFAGYQWTPGTAPHDNPTIGELRMIYKSKVIDTTSPGWKDEKFELPGVTLSDDAKEHLKKVRFLTVYIVMLNHGSIDNVTVTKVADPAMKFD